MADKNEPLRREIAIPAGHRILNGILVVPRNAVAVVAFAHGSGSGRHSSRNQFVAGVLQQAGLATLLLDLLEEGEEDDRSKVFDIELLAERLQFAAAYLKQEPATRALPLGYFGASTGAGAALVAAARHPEGVAAVVSRGGRPDLAGEFLSAVRAPTLLIVGGNDDVVIDLNEQAMRLLECKKEMVVVPGATHLFPEPGTLEQVARLAMKWFLRYLPETRDPAERSSPAAVEGGALAAEEVTIFRDREDAARRLAAKLKKRDLHDPLVLAIPRGGVVTGAVLAEELGAELDVVLSRKLRAPYQPELALGAISEAGEVYLNSFARGFLDELEDYLAGERQHQMSEIARRKKLFRQVRPAAAVAGRSVIVTDDGIATGSTMIAALHTVKAQNPGGIIVAVPIASPSRLQEIRPLCDEIVCLLSPETFQAIGQFYYDFSQVEDETVVELLRQSVEADRRRKIHAVAEH
jgi:predicted phosphoribosyltransferase/pimeloyl-ACP methyl ester carboxylesterase